MEDIETIRKSARREDAVLKMALVVLLARAGGTLAFTHEEYETSTEQYGGSIHFEGLGPKRATGPNEIRVVLVRKPPGDARLPS